MSEDFHLILESLINGNTKQAVNQLLDSDYERPMSFFEDLIEYYWSNEYSASSLVHAQRMTAKMASYLVCRYADLVRSEATCKFLK